MIGQWNGHYKFESEKIQKIRGFEMTKFEIIIQKFDGINFEGIVNDDIETGGMAETGKIIGNVENSIVSFEKFMPKRNVLNLKGGRKEIEGAHPILYYSGILSKNKSEIIGTWEFRKQISFLFGFIPIRYRPGKGSWKMNLS